MANKSHKLKIDDERISVPCYDARVPDYYLIVEGVRNEEPRTHKIRSPCIHLARNTRDNFFKESDSHKSTHQLMKEHGWSDIKLIGIERVKK